MNFGNLGIAMGAGVDEMHKQRATDREDAQAQRQAQEWAQKQEQYARQQKQQLAMDNLTSKYAGYREKAAKGDHSFLDELGGEYNKNQGAWADGQEVYKQSTPQGEMAHFVGADGKVARSMPINQQTVSQMLNDAYMAELKYTSPEMFQSGYYKDREHGLKTQELGVKQEGNTITRDHYARADATNDAHLTRSDATNEAYRSNQAPLLAAQARYYDRMPREGGGGGGGGGGKSNWVPVAEDTDGTPVFYDQKGIDPRNPSASFVRPDGKPVVDMKTIYAKMSGARPQKPEFDPSKVVYMEDKDGLKKPYNMTERGLVPIPVMGQGGPQIVKRETPVLGGEGGFRASGARHNILQPSAEPQLVQNPQTGDWITQDDMDRLMRPRGLTLFDRIRGR